MMRKFLSILLAATIAVTSLDMTVYAVETEQGETVLTQEAKLNDETEQIAKNKDYTIEAYQVGETVLDQSSNPKEGTQITITIKGKGNYEGTAKVDYKLEGISIAKVAIKVTPKSYTGKPVTIEASDITSATVKIGKTKIGLKLGQDYEIAAYRNNLKKGTATVIFRGIGNYAGEKRVQFKIMPTAILGKNIQVKSEGHFDLIAEP